ncbi:CHAT domain-containing protein [Suillus ampliporus]|nr:CHAT domain-containing protein [Suillus ampliporus]
MSSFVPDLLDDRPPPSGEESNHPEHPQEPGTNLVISEMLQAVVNRTCHLIESSFSAYRRFPAAILTIPYFVIDKLFRFAPRAAPNPLDDTLPPLSEEQSHPEHPQDQGETPLSGIQRVAITAIRATDLALGLRRIPAGFHVTLQADGAEWQTSNRPVHIDQDVVEWDDRILLPCEPSLEVRVSVYASFELGPMLGHGELLRALEISVGELLDRSEKSHPIIFQPRGDVVSPCTSLFMTVAQRHSDEHDAAVLCPLDIFTSAGMHTLVLKTVAGHCLLARYRRMQRRRDLDQSIKHFEGASDLCPVDHPCRPAALFNLATAKSVSYQVNGTYPDLDISISLFQDAIDLRPSGHLDRAITQLHLAIALLSRFAKRGSRTDADAAEELLSDVMSICNPNSHIYKAALLAIETSALHPARSIDANDLGQERPVVSMLPLSLDELARQAEWCLQRDDPRVLDEAISLHYDALEYYSTAHADRGQLLWYLDSMLLTRFERQGNNRDLDEAIALQMEVLALHPIDRASSLNNLANRLWTRFEHRGNVQDLDGAIALHREALALHPVGHPDRFMSLNSLGNRLSIGFKHRENVQDLDEAIVLQREALALRPVRNDQDLDDAIVLHREALALHPVSHPDRSISLNGLGNRLSVCFEHRGNVQDLDEAIVLHREALALRPVGHPLRPMSLNNLGTRLFLRCKHQGNEDLDEVIVLHREALALRPVGHPGRSISLNNLGNPLSLRFERRGNVQDLNEAIVLHREALALHPVGHPDRSGSLINLGIQLSIRFDRQGNDQDLDEAIVLHREALALHPVGHPHRFMSLNSLGTRLSICFKHRGNDQDLDEAIVLQRETLALHPVGHPHRSGSLGNLGNQLSLRFDHRGNIQDLDEAISLQREALALHPVGHPDRLLSLHNLGNHVLTRFTRLRNNQDLDEAIVLYSEALDLCPVGHPDRSDSLRNLAAALSTRFGHRPGGNTQDLNESLEHCRCALTLLTQHDPRQLEVHGTLALVYLLVHASGLNGTGEYTDSLNAAMHHFKAAANVVSGGLLHRLRASVLWVSWADEYAHDTALEAYATSMQLLDAYMSATASVSSRHHAMKDFPSTLAVDAASCALRCGDLCRAVELLEQGRTLIWTQMARFRTPLDSLQERGDHAQILMKKFRDLSSVLDNPPAKDSEGTRRVDVEAEAARYRRLVTDWNTTVEEIRKLEDFSCFLLPPLFPDLQDAARDGPIVVLLASKSSCDAIIVSHQQLPIRVGLTINVENLVRLVNALQRTVAKEAGPRGTQAKLIEALRELWVEVVHPVVQNLHRVAKPGSRIWWCPTSFFNFLPVHAAGEYRPGGTSFSQLYISSYTPSLTALIKARRSHDRSLPVSFAAIGQNHPPGHEFPLTCVEPELNLVQSLLPPSPTVSFTKVTSVESTKSAALRTLRDNHWIHFACHGTQNFVEPFKSAFLMRDQPLQLLDISHTDLSRHEFAFLSACKTAVGNVETPDEAIHLAAGLQFSGVKSVIGTFWNVDDSTVQRLVEAFYKNFCGDSKMDSKRAARALHKAVQSLKDVPLDQRMVFMHIGL